MAPLSLAASASGLPAGAPLRVGWRDGVAVDGGDEVEHPADAVVGEAVVDGVAAAAGGDQAVVAQAGELLGHGRLAEAEDALELGDRALPVRDEAEEHEPALVGEGLEEVARM